MDKSKSRKRPRDEGKSDNHKVNHKKPRISQSNSSTNFTKSSQLNRKGKRNSSDSILEPTLANHSAPKPSKSTERVSASTTRLASPGSNWEKLKDVIAPSVRTPPAPQAWLKYRTPKSLRPEKEVNISNSTVTNKHAAAAVAANPVLGKLVDPTLLTKIVALDCEMVGVGPKGIDSALARVVILNSFGRVLYDKHVGVKEKITDYRTKYSGIHPGQLDNAPSFEEIQAEVHHILKGRIVVGHGLIHDFKALMLSHPYKDTRDTSKYRPLQRSKGLPHSLKYLAKSELGIVIQETEHDPAEDARTALNIYKKHKKAWDMKLKKKKYKLKHKKISGLASE